MTFGPSVIGDVKFAAQQKHEEKAGFGPAVLDPDYEAPKTGFVTEPPPGTDTRRIAPKPKPAKQVVEKVADPADIAAPLPEPAVDDDVLAAPDDHVQSFMMGIRELRDQLTGNPMLVDDFMRAELERPTGIRRTAAKAMHDAEMKRTDVQGGPRTAVISALNSMMDDR